MKKAHEILATLNILRAKLGKAPIAKWKESNAKLLEAVRKAEVAVAALAPVKVEKKAKAVKATKDQVQAKAGSLFATLGVNAKVARAKLRKAYGSDWRSLTAEEITAFLTKK